MTISVYDLPGDIPGATPDGTVVGVRAPLPLVAGSNTPLDPTDGVLATATMTDDGTASAGPDRLKFTYTPVSGPARTPFWLSDCFEPRCMPRTNNTVGFRVFVAPDASSYASRDAGSNVWEMTDQRDGTRTPQVWMRKGGHVGMLGDLAVSGALTVGGAPVVAPVDFELKQRMAPVAGTNTVGVIGCVYGGTGTATAAAVASTSRYTSIPRVDLLVTTAATTAVAGIRTTAASLIRGTASNAGGFKAKLIAGPATGVTTTTSRYFQGFRNVTSAPTDVEPSSLVNMIGIGWDAADATVKIMSNDASGVATEIDTTWAIPTADRTALYSFAVSCIGGASGLTYTLKDEIFGTTLTGTLTTDIPANTVALLPLCYASVGGTSSVIGITFVDYQAKVLML